MRGLNVSYVCSVYRADLGITVDTALFSPHRNRNHFHTYLFPYTFAMSISNKQMQTLNEIYSFLHALIPSRAGVSQSLH